MGQNRLDGGENFLQFRVGVDVAIPVLQDFERKIRKDFVSFLFCI